MAVMGAIVKRFLFCDKISFIVTGMVVLLATTSGDSEIALSKGNYTWILAALSPFFFQFYVFKKLIYLGGRKKDIFGGSRISYGILACIISMINTGIYIGIDPLNEKQNVLNLMEICGWKENNIMIAFVQQMVFLYLAMVFLDMLLSMQSLWIGWVVDGLLIAIISIFTLIAPLRHMLTEFFQIIMFNSHAIFHIMVCLCFSAGLSVIGLLILKRKAI